MNTESAGSCAVIGLGKLGACVAAACASRGFHVVGVDYRQELIDRMNNGVAPVAEPGLADAVSANRHRLRATLSHRDAIANSTLSFIVVPTPSTPTGAFSLQFASAACEQIGRALRDTQTYHLVVLCSTVLPGASRQYLIPLLERHSHKHCGHDFGYCYSPQFIALGSVLHNFLNPDFVLIGHDDVQSAALLHDTYARLLSRVAPIHTMSLENAELTKLAVNAFLTTKITFANVLADLCERLPGGDIDAVTRAMGSDHRIGSGCLEGGLGYGGPCFPRDNAALVRLATALGCDADISAATDRLNRNRPTALARRIMEYASGSDTVAVLGLSYKPNTAIIEDSQAIALITALAAAGLRVVAYDPLTDQTVAAGLAGFATVTTSVAACLRQATVVVITGRGPEILALTADDFSVANCPLTVIDCWRILEPVLRDREGITYVPLGRNVDVGVDVGEGAGRLHDLSYESAAPGTTGPHIPEEVTHDPRDTLTRSSRL